MTFVLKAEYMNCAFTTPGCKVHTQHFHLESTVHAQSPSSVQFEANRPRKILDFQSKSINPIGSPVLRGGEHNVRNNFKIFIASPDLQFPIFLFPNLTRLEQYTLKDLLF